ncbi:hypothetical protein [Novacetimonas hansenii]|uniref:hypothetical protein n=1 Tax=Novacetimonas hansenii TaxID=436 RepID=UPI00248D8E2D|nr:hypothetical protein [Novacetimonas hansenii]
MDVPPGVLLPAILPPHRGRVHDCGQGSWHILSLSLSLSLSLRAPARLAHITKIDEGLFENTSLIENRQSFWVPPFDRKRRRLLKLFGKRFTKNFYHFSMLSRLTF